MTGIVFKELFKKRGLGQSAQAKLLRNIPPKSNVPAFTQQYKPGEPRYTRSYALLTDELLAQYVELIAEGYKHYHACEMLNIVYAAVYHYRKQHPEFNAAVKQAEHLWRERVIRKVYELGFESAGNISKWYQGEQKGTEALPPNPSFGRLYLELEMSAELKKSKADINVQNNNFNAPTRLLTINTEASLEELKQLGHSRLTEEYKALMEKPLKNSSSNELDLVAEEVHPKGK